MNNESLYNKAKKHLVGGVNSPIRAISPYPFFTDHAKGAYLWDVEDNRYCDYCLAYGPLILGHADPDIVAAVNKQLDMGTTYGTPTEIEVLFAAQLCDMVPNVEMIRCVNSGTEATMAALRLARGITSRNEIVTVSGGYHGSHDGVLAKSTGSGVVPSSLGVTHPHIVNTKTVEFNDIESLSSALEGDGAAAFIIEPVMGNIGCIPPEKGYLKEVRKICTETGTLLIFDETITGFRLSPGGAQEYFGIDADIVTYGKIAGGGFPIGIIGSTKERMEYFSPMGKVYNAGTFSGNPVSMAAGLAALKKIAAADVLKKVHRSHSVLIKGLYDLMSNKAAVQSAPGMFQIYFGVDSVSNNVDVQKADKKIFDLFWKNMLNDGYFLPPSQFESNFISFCHDKDIVYSTLEAMESAIQ